MKMDVKLIAAAMIAGVMTLTGCSVRSAEEPSILSFTHEKADSLFTVGKDTKDDVVKVLGNNYTQEEYKDSSDSVIYYYCGTLLRGENLTPEQKARVPEKYIKDAYARVEKRMVYQFGPDNVLKDKEFAGYYIIFHHEPWKLGWDLNRELTPEELDAYQSDADALKLPLDNPKAGPDHFRLLENIK